MQTQTIEKARRIKLLILDVDGVLTDGKLFYDVNGEALKVFHVLDGHGIKLLMQSGVNVAIISARKSPMVARRAADLGIPYVQQGIDNKYFAFLELLKETRLQAQDCGFIGDDVIDLPILTRVGFAASVPNGHPEVTMRVDYITKTYGGNGAVREVCDFIMRAQNNYDAIMESFLK